MKWLKIILNSKSGRELANHTKEAALWASCAVGEFAQAFPEANKGPYFDDCLLELGNAFHDAVATGNKRKALLAYRRIEARFITLCTK